MYHTIPIPFVISSPWHKLCSVGHCFNAPLKIDVHHVDSHIEDLQILRNKITEGDPPPQKLSTPSVKH